MLAKCPAAAFLQGELKNTREKKEAKPNHRKPARSQTNKRCHQQPGAVLRAEAEAGHQDLRAAGGGAAEVVRGAGAGVQGPAPGRLGARDLPEAAEGEAGSPLRGGEAAQDGKCALRGCGLTAGACELDHVVPVRQAFAGSVQTLQALCGDCHSVKTLRESAQPREPRCPRRHGVRPEPQAASSGF